MNPFMHKHSKLDSLLRSVLAIRFSASSIQLRLIERDHTIELPPLLALDHNNQIVAVGDDARQRIAHAPPGTLQLANPFAHPRLCIHDMDLAERLLAHLTEPLFRNRTYISRLNGLIARPTIVLQPQHELAGGITQVELNVLLAIGLNLGTTHVYVWIGRTLSDAELHALTFPIEEGQLFFKHARS